MNYEPESDFIETSQNTLSHPAYSLELNLILYFLFKASEPLKVIFPIDILRAAISSGKNGCNYLTAFEKLDNFKCQT